VGLEIVHDFRIPNQQHINDHPLKSPKNTLFWLKWHWPYSGTTTWSRCRFKVLSPCDRFDPPFIAQRGPRLEQSRIILSSLSVSGSSTRATQPGSREIGHRDSSLDSGSRHCSHLRSELPPPPIFRTGHNLGTQFISFDIATRDKEMLIILDRRILDANFPCRMRRAFRPRSAHFEDPLDALRFAYRRTGKKDKASWAELHDGWARKVNELVAV